MRFSGLWQDGGRWGAGYGGDVCKKRESAFNKKKKRTEKKKKRLLKAPWFWRCSVFRRCAFDTETEVDRVDWERGGTSPFDLR